MSRNVVTEQSSDRDKDDEAGLVPPGLGNIGKLLFRRSMSQEEDDYDEENWEDDYYWDEYDAYGESFEKGMYSGGSGGGGGGKKKKTTGQVYSQKHIRQQEARRQSNKPKKANASKRKH